MARTYAQAQAEKARLLALGRRLQVRLIKNPLRGTDTVGTNIYPGGPATNDYLLEVKDPRGSANIEGANEDHFRNEASFRIFDTSGPMEDADPPHDGGGTRWHDAAAAHEHEIRTRGLMRGANTVGNGAHTGWLVYGAGEDREPDDTPANIPSATTVFAAP